MLNQKITENLKKAMKAGREFEVGVLRMVLASVHNKEIEKKAKSKDTEETLSNEEIIEVLLKEAKKRKEAIEIYKKGNREELAEKEAKELEIIKNYLPEEAPIEEIEKIVKSAIEKTGAKTEKEFGLVMKETMKELKDKADASVVSEIIKRELENKI
ncbi:GatB/YqeY domain-containing protein [Candidatus Wolfebacteria bacterium]|nr:GatB/YqeY domain-containing protein [Candidatus Wolfebacteria bacterium]